MCNNLKHKKKHYFQDVRSEACFMKVFKSFGNRSQRGNKQLSGALLTAQTIDPSSSSATI